MIVDYWTPVYQAVDFADEPIEQIRDWQTEHFDRSVKYEVAIGPCLQLYWPHCRSSLESVARREPEVSSQASSASCSVV